MFGKMTVFWTKFLTLLLISAVSVGSQKCGSTDGQCLKSTAQELVPVLSAGLPDLGAPPLDPLHLAKVKVDLAGLNLLVTDANAKGLKKTIIDKINIDRSKKVLELKYITDIVLKGKYKASGRLLILPISGDGDITLKLSDAMLTFMNSNWKELTVEFGSPLLEAAHKIMVESIKKYLATQPIED